MAGRAFNVPVPVSYNNVTEAKLIQKGSDVWIQLPPNLVADRRMNGKSVYKQDYCRSVRIPHRLRNVKAKVVSRRGRIHPRPLEDFSSFHGYNSIPQNRTKCCSSSFEGMNSRYADMKSRRNGPITALLPVMRDGPELSMDHHYSSPSMLTGRMSTEKTYNDKAREALPGLGKWLESDNDIKSIIPTNHGTAIDGDDFLENPLRRPDLMNYDHKRSVVIRTPRRARSSHYSSTSALGTRLDEGQTLLDNADRTISLDLPTFENSAKRHELEILTKVNPHSTTVNDLYQPSAGYNTGNSGYTVVANNYEHGNGTFSSTNPDNRSSFEVAPDWVSERKKSLVMHR